LNLDLHTVRIPEERPVSVVAMNWKDFGTCLWQIKTRMTTEDNDRLYLRGTPTSNGNHMERSRDLPVTAASERNSPPNVPEGTGGSKSVSSL